MPNRLMGRPVRITHLQRLYTQAGPENENTAQEIYLAFEAPGPSRAIFRGLVSIDGKNAARPVRGGHEADHLAEVDQLFPHTVLLPSIGINQTQLDGWVQYSSVLTAGLMNVKNAQRYADEAGQIYGDLTIPQAINTRDKNPREKQVWATHIQKLHAPVAKEVESEPGTPRGLWLVMLAVGVKRALLLDVADVTPGRNPDWPQGYPFSLVRLNTIKVPVKTYTGFKASWVLEQDTGANWSLASQAIRAAAWPDNKAGLMVREPWKAAPRRGIVLAPVFD